MVKIEFSSYFEKKLRKVKDWSMKAKIKIQIYKIIKNPEIGKPMMYTRLGTREVYVTPFRISYLFSKKQDSIIFLDIYHKDQQ